MNVLHIQTLCTTVYVIHMLGHMLHVCASIHTHTHTHTHVETLRPHKKGEDPSVLNTTVECKQARMREREGERLQRHFVVSFVILDYILS